METLTFSGYVVKEMLECLNIDDVPGYQMSWEGINCMNEGNKFLEKS